MQPIRGINLRYALTQQLFDEGPQTVAELVKALEEQGFQFPGRASKAVSDALRWEIRRSRVRRLGRSNYGPAYMPRQTAARIRDRVAALRSAAEEDLYVGGSQTFQP
ncbi:hypothetical protein FOS14_20645 [Skermania sp. ID1734]|uniref:hypothetical protein n=1 Tax=Skermania sp. ID1734 TaxID=2597516 RepID=UPI00117E0A61|nr:hypothetical protein [Skermania sp. ID1734]TSD94431.1 hypothetical protein FOS14_20645 [Skermania sp. ID1734]